MDLASETESHSLMVFDSALPTHLAFGSESHSQREFDSELHSH